MIGIASAAATAFSSAELSYANQSSLPVPSAVKAAIFEGFARQNMTEIETDLQPAIISHLRLHPGDGFLFSGDSPLSLFNKLVLCCIQSNGTLCFPSGAPGNYVSAAKFLGAATATIRTEPQHSFKLTPHSPSSSLQQITNPWVYLSCPTACPTGAVYTSQEIDSLLQSFPPSCTVILDTSFSGLEFSSSPEKWLLGRHPESTVSVAMLGGLSLELLTGGPDFGFLHLNNPSLAETFSGFHLSLSKPHSTTRYALKKLLSLDTLPSADHKTILRHRATALSGALTECGCEVVDCQGGVSLVAKGPLMEKIVEKMGLRVNSDAWTGIQGYYRFSLALPEEEFAAALDGIRRFSES